MGCCVSKKRAARLQRPSKAQEVAVPLPSAKDPIKFPEMTEPTQISENEHRPLVVTTKRSQIPKASKVAVQTAPPAYKPTVNVPQSTSQSQWSVDSTQKSYSTKQREWQEKVRQQFTELSEKTQEHVDDNQSDAPTPPTELKLSGVQKEGSNRQFTPTQEEQSAKSVESKETIKLTSTKKIN
ncbi:hypothetical protein M3Y96_00190600 [Aphelenchoides besseyi]|nr:hypothetical protein M3Y96_00188000 [Aphelenchoides besseyi]KAI6209150.1 hypothetical protein M3Y96_00190600 [Aphelenchoides besseyi]